MAKVAHTVRLANAVGELKSTFLVGVHDDGDPTLDSNLPIFKVEVMKDNYDALAAAEKTALDAVTLGGLLAVTGYGAKTNL